MKTLHEIRQIERYLLNKLDTPSRLVFEAQLLIDPILKFKVQWQQSVHAIVRKSGRRNLKFEMERIHGQLFEDPSKENFKKDILQNFSKT